MTTRDLLLREINQAPEDVLQAMLKYIQTELQESNKSSKNDGLKTNGPYRDYWNQFVGVFANEPWERPDQGEMEQRAEW